MRFNIHVPNINLSGFGGGGVTDHGVLEGLGDDDHTHYFNQARGDIRYALSGSISPPGSTSLSGLIDVQSTNWTSGVHVGWNGTLFVPSTPGDALSTVSGRFIQQFQATDTIQITHNLSGNPQVTTLDSNFCEMEVGVCHDNIHQTTLAFNGLISGWFVADVTRPGGVGPPFAGATNYSGLTDVQNSGWISGTIGMYDGTTWVPNEHKLFDPQSHADIDPFWFTPPRHGQMLYFNENLGPSDIHTWDTLSTPGANGRYLRSFSGIHGGQPLWSAMQIVDDLSPELGNNLDMNSRNILNLGDPGIVEGANDKDIRLRSVSHGYKVVLYEASQNISGVSVEQMVSGFGMDLEVHGSLFMTGKLVHKAEFRIHPTDTRTIQFPDTTDWVVVQDYIQTLSNKTLTLPTIGDFTNAQHDHLDAAGGGLITGGGGGGGGLPGVEIDCGTFADDACEIDAGSFV